MCMLTAWVSTYTLASKCILETSAGKRIVRDTETSAGKRIVQDTETSAGKRIVWNTETSAGKRIVRDTETSADMLQKHGTGSEV